MGLVVKAFTAAKTTAIRAMAAIIQIRFRITFQ
jgi:hypothetical protein